VTRLRPIAGGSNTFFADPALIDHHTISKRLKWIAALRDIVSAWPSPLPKPHDFSLEPRSTDKGIRVDDLMALEVAVAKQYFRVAEEILGRRPTIA